METHGGRVRWIAMVPNALSVSRLLLAFCFPFLEWPWRAVVIVVVAISDVADGYIARRFDAVTWIGGLLDPAADKAFVFIVFATYLAAGHLAPGEVVLLLARDIVVLAVAGYLASIRLWGGFKEMPARPFGKIATGAMFLLLLLIALTGDDREPLVTATLGVAILASVAAAIDYLIVFVRRERDRRRAERMSAADR